MKKRIGTVLLALCMMLGLLTVTALAMASYTVTYNANGADAGASTVHGSKSYSYNAEVTVLGKPDGLNRNGYSFDGWNTEADGTGTDYWEGDTFTITENTTLYAKWVLDVTPGDNLTLNEGYAAGSTISVNVAEIADHTLSYEWRAGGLDGTKIEGATGNSYAIPTGLTKGTYKYTCIVTATRTSDSQSAQNHHTFTVTVNEVHPVCGEVCTHDADPEQDGIQPQHESVQWTAWDGVGAFPGGNVYLLSDCTVDSAIVISDTVNLCLNGKTVTYSGSGTPNGIFVVEGNGVLNLCSCESGGTIQRTTKSEDVSLIYARNGANANLYNVTLDGGAVWGGTEDAVLQRGTSNQGISSSAPLIDAGYQRSAGGHITLNAGVILRNNVCSDSGAGGAVTVGEDGSLVINGATICNNATTAGGPGAIKAYAGATVTMNSGEIYGNRAYTHGGAIQIFGGDSTDYASVSFTMAGGTIRNNKAEKVGGAIAVSNYSQFTMTGGAIQNNTTTDSQKRGGGVGFIDENTAMSISGNAVIEGNHINNHPNNLYIGTNACNIVTVGVMTSGANVMVTMKNGTGTFTEGWAEHMGQQEISDWFKCDNENFYITKDESGELMVDYKSKAADEVLDWELADTGWFNTTYRPIFTPKTGYKVATDPNGYYSTEVELGNIPVNALYVRETATGMIYQVDISYQIDLQDPSIDGVSGNPTEWTGGEVTLTVTATDCGDADLAPEAYSFDGGQTWQAKNTKTYTENTADIVIKVRDAAGNTTTYETLSITKIDKVRPDITHWSFDGNVEGWNTSNISSSVIVYDNNAILKWQYSLDGGESWRDGPETDRGSFMVMGDSVHSVKVKAIDQAGNEAVSEVREIRIDTTAPDDISVTAKVGGDDYTSGAETHGDVVFTLTGGVDTVSGFDKFQYKIGEDSWEDMEGSTFTHTASTDEDGVTYKFRAVDKAGNASGEVEFTVKKSFPVRFNACGGTGEMADVYVYRNGAVAMPACGFTRSGYTFTGWYTEADYSGTEYLQGNEIINITERIDGGFDLYAKWEIVYYVTIDLNGSGAAGPMDFEYTVESDDRPLSNPTREGYTFKGWSGTGLEGDANTNLTISTGSVGNRSYTAHWIANTYTVKFDANGGKGTMADMAFVYDEAQNLTANAFTYSGHNFVSWNTEEDGTGTPYIDGASVENLSTENGTAVILYAQWSKEPVFDVSGEVHLHDGTEPGHKVHVTIQKGSKILAEAETNEAGHYDLHNVPAGTYNIVAIDHFDGEERTTTARVDVGSNTNVDTLILPEHDVSSELNVSAGTPDIVVGGLEAEASAQDDDTDNTHVTLCMTVEQKEDVTGESEESGLKTQQVAIKETAGSQKNNLTFLKIDLEKIIESDGSSGGEGSSPVPVTETNTLLEIHVPFTTGGRENFKVYRYHDSQAETLKKNPAAGEEGYVVGKGEIVIYAKKFSTYAIGYTETVDEPTYRVKVADSEHGSAKVRYGYYYGYTTVSINVMADEGYEPDTLTVTDSRGNDIAVTDAGDGRYTFRMPYRDVTVQATFKEIEKNWSNCVGDGSCPLYGFEDVDPGVDYHDAAHFCMDLGLMHGCPGNVFAPELECTRVTITVMLWRLEGCPVVNYALHYEDAPADAWYFEALRWAASERIAMGYPGDVFGVNDLMSREAVATLLWRYAQHKGYDVSEGENTNILSYEDVGEVSEFAVPAMQWACGIGLLEDLDGSTLNPAGSVNRAQIAKAFFAFCQDVK